jgi:hypothetical protein
MKANNKSISLCLILAVTSLAACDEAAVVIPDDPIEDAIYETLTEQWWIWSYSIPGPDHPILDETGASCQLGDVSDELFFLAGSNSGAATRSCTVPATKALFFPLINGAALNNPADPAKTAAELAADLDGLFVLACDLELTLDGQPLAPSLADNRVTAGPFEVEIADGHFANEAPYNLPPGTYDPVMSDGYWALVTPPPPGEHLLEFGGSLCVDGEPIFTTHVSYHLTVADVSI